MARKMGTLRRFFKDTVIILQDATDNNDMNAVSEVIRDIDIVQHAMQGGKKWSEVEIAHVHLLESVRAKAQLIEDVYGPEVIVA